MSAIDAQCTLFEKQMTNLFVIQNMKRGGVQKSLINLFNELLERNEHIYLLILEQGTYNVLYKTIPTGVDIISLNKFVAKICTLIGTSKENVLRKKKIGDIIIKVFFSIMLKSGLEKLVAHILFHNIYKIYSKVDIICSFDGLPALSDIYVRNAPTKAKRVAWIHNVYVRFGISRSQTLRLYRRFDAIAIVSNECKKIFDEYVPLYRNKTYTVYNCMDIQRIRKLADEPQEIINNSAKLIFITVARIQNSSKRIDRLLEAVSLLKQRNIDEFSLYIIGDGPDKKKCMEMTAKLQIQNNCFFLGEQHNPYPFIKAADMFVVSSDYEGFSIVISESLILGRPVLTTDFSVAKERIEVHKEGYIVEKTSKALAEKMEEIIRNPEILDMLNEQIGSKEYTNSLAVKQFFQIQQLGGSVNE